MTGLAFDKATVRTVDKFGRLHVSLSNMSKATVNPYKGSEIPNWAGLGLDPERIYLLLRDPEELAKAAATFNNLPVLSEHVKTTADAHQPDLIVGSTGTDAAFVEPYLQNSSVIWVTEAIDLINNDKQKEWSCSYSYVADMTPGTYKGLRYDGIMRNIHGNHVALVEEGRAGSDVVVGDSKLETSPMALSRKALLVWGLLSSKFTGAVLANDARPDFAPALADVTGKNFLARKPSIAAAVAAELKGKLANDATLDVAEVVEILDALKDDDDAPTAGAEDDADTPSSKVMAFLQGKLSDEDLKAVAGLCGAGGADDEDPDDEDEDKPKPKKDDDDVAKDAAIRAAVRATEKRLVANATAIRQAERDVQPVIGDIAVAMDSAAGVYKLALDHLNVDLDGVDRAAYGAVFRALQKTKATTGETPLAMDRKRAGSAQAEFDTLFPTASKLIRSV